MRFTPFLLVLEITGRCNLRCSYCYLDGPERDGHLEVPLIRDILEQACALGTRHVILSGGEPFLHPEIPIILDLVHGLDLRVHITSNGFGLDNKLLQILQRVRAHVTISVDGSRAALNDPLRGKGTYRTALASVEALKAHGVYTSMRMTVVKSNLEDVENYLRMAIRTGVDRCIFERMTPVGNGRELRNEVIDAGQLRRLFVQMRLNLCNGLQIGTNDPLWILFRKPFLQKKKDDRFISAGCTAGVAAFCVRPDLTVTGCPRLPVPCGSLARHSLSQIWEQSEVFAQLRDRDLFEKCGRCRFKFLCGGCRGAAHGQGNYLGPDPQCWIPVQ